MELRQKFRGLNKDLCCGICPFCQLFKHIRSIRANVLCSSVSV